MAVDFNPIRMEFISAKPGASGKPVRINTVNSYSFDRSVLTPASAFRFTAGSVDKATRLKIRSGDTVRLFINDKNNHPVAVATGFVDETDTHGTGSALEYVITGRDTVGQLVDNDAVDIQNKIVLFQKANLDTAVGQLIANTRLAQSFRSKQLDRNVQLVLATSPGETKLNILQRYLEFVNGLVWADPDGVLVVDKPDFTQNPAATFTVSESKVNTTNVTEFRVRRNINQAVRQIVTQQNGTEAAASITAAETLHNMDKRVAEYAGTLVGRSISRTFNYAQGGDLINQGIGPGNGSFGPHTLARGYSAREIAKENQRVLDVEVVVDGHFTPGGRLYNIDQIYQVNIEDEDVAEPMYCYNVSYELTPDHGIMTRLKLCPKWTICAYADQLERVVK